MERAIFKQPIYPVSQYREDLRILDAKLEDFDLWKPSQPCGEPSAWWFYGGVFVLAGFVLAFLVLGWGVVEAFTVINAARLGE